MVVNKEQKVAVFVDIQNMYYSAKNLYNKKVDFGAILKKATNGRKLIRAFAYVIKADIDKEKEFHHALDKAGYEVKSKGLQTFYGGNKKGDWDIGIAMDVIKLAQKVDTIVLVSGDGDFQELLQYVSFLGCKTEVIAFSKSASNKIKEEADEFFDMDKESDKYLMKGRSPQRITVDDKNPVKKKVVKKVEKPETAKKKVAKKADESKILGLFKRKKKE